MKRERESEGCALPGMEGLVHPAGMRPAETDMRDGKVFTAACLYKEHPRVFESVCVALFKHRLPVRWIAELLMVSEHTVRAIERYVLVELPETDAGRAALFIKSSANRSRLMANRSAIELLQRRMDENPDGLTVAEILAIAEATGEGEGERTGERTGAKEAVVDAEFVDAFDDILNGLEREKKSAGEAERRAAVREADGERDGEAGEGEKGRDEGVRESSTEND